MKSYSLSEVFKDPKKAPYISKSKINLTYCNISKLDLIPSQYHNCPLVHLSHNSIPSLKQISQFQNITHFSIAHNKLKTWEELLHLTSPEVLVELNIKGNPLEYHPNHIFLILEKFPSLSKIDALCFTKTDRENIKKYWVTSGLVLPFFLQLEDDQVIIEECIQRLKITTDIRKTSKDLTIENLNIHARKAEDLYIKLLRDLLNPEYFLEIDKVLTKYKKTKLENPVAVFSMIEYVMDTLFPTLEYKVIDDRKLLLAKYKKLFNDMMLRFISVHNKTLDQFLTNQVVKNGNYDMKRFTDDNEYAFKSILYEFYKLMPNQATIGHNISVRFDEQVQKPDLRKGETIVDISQHDPDILDTACVTHFPIFPFNQVYNSHLLTLMIQELEVVYNMGVEIFQTLSMNSERISRLRGPREFFEGAWMKVKPQTAPFSFAGSQREDIDENHYVGLEAQQGQQDNLEVLKNPGKLKIFASTDNQSTAGRTKRSQMEASMEKFHSRSGQGWHNTAFGVIDESDRYFKDGVPEDKCVLPILTVVRIDRLKKIMLRWGFDSLCDYTGDERVIKKKQILKDFYTDIRVQLGQGKIRRIMQEWFKISNRGGRQMAGYYKKNLLLKAFFAILNLMMKRRKALKPILEKLAVDQVNNLNTCFNKWRLMNSMVTYIRKKEHPSAWYGKNPYYNVEGHYASVVRNDGSMLREKDRERERAPRAKRSQNYLSHVFRKCEVCVDNPECSGKHYVGDSTEEGYSSYE